MVNGKPIIPARRHKSQGQNRQKLKLTVKWTDSVNDRESNEGSESPNPKEDAKSIVKLSKIIEDERERQPMSAQHVKEKEKDNEKIGIYPVVKLPKEMAKWQQMSETEKPRNPLIDNMRFNKCKPQVPKAPKPRKKFNSDLDQEVEVMSNQEIQNYIHNLGRELESNKEEE